MTRSLLLVAAIALASLGCGRAAPRARIEVTRLPDTRPPMAIARCLTSGLRPPIRYLWTLGRELRQWGWRVPHDEEALMLTVPASPGAGAGLACRAIDATGTVADAASSLAPITILAVRPPVTPAAPLTVEGRGFGAQRAAGDGVWLVPPRGPALAADPGCKGGSWSDTRIVACLPPEARGRTLEVRVESRGRLAAGPPIPRGAAR